MPCGFFNEIWDATGVAKRGPTIFTIRRQAEVIRVRVRFRVRVTTFTIRRQAGVKLKKTQTFLMTFVLYLQA